MPLTRKTLIDTLTANGLQGEATIDNCKAHVAKLAAQGIDLQDDAGNSIDVDSVWTAKSVLRVAGEADAIRGTASPHGAIADEAADAGVPQRFSIGSPSRKAYQAKIRAGKAAFNDADQAEAFGAWARLSTLGNTEYGQKKADLDITRKAQVIFNNQLGGALVPVEFIPNLVYLTEQYGVARKVANVVTMARDVTTVPRKTAIASMSPVAETGTLSPTDNSYGNVTLTAKKYGVLYQVSRELLADSAVNIADDLARSIAEAQAIAEDQAYFLGNGTATYANQIGLTLALPSAAYRTAAALAWGSMTVASFTDAMGAVENINPARLAFVCSRQFFAQVMLRVDKTANQFKELSMGGLGGDATFLGYPVFFSQVMPTATGSSVRSCYFGDFIGGTMLGDRRQLEIQTSDQFYFSTDALAVRGTSRFNTVIHGDGRGSTVGPIACMIGA